ncbi:hypothetical protein J2X68_008082 [Streptomyces sp. 3330]|nr:hypothetical protein [Streptomyces sp. 3330]
MEQLRELGVRCEELLLALMALQRRSSVRADAELYMVVSLCCGRCLTDCVRVGGDALERFAERVGATVWP